MPTDDLGLEILNRLKSTDAPLWLAPNPSLSQEARAASLRLFSSLKPYEPTSPLDRLLIDGFDAEQIWQQIELQSQPLLAALKREVRRFEKNPKEILRLLAEKTRRKNLEERKGSEEGDADGFDDVERDLDAMDEDGGEESEEEDGLGDGIKDEEEEEDGDEDGDDDDDDDDGKGEDEGVKGGIEDEFLKVKELEEYLQKDEAREYGLEGAGKKAAGKKGKGGVYDDDDEDDYEADEGEEEDGDEVRMAIVCLFRVGRR